jgi:hypothetical protein
MTPRDKSLIPKEDNGRLGRIRTADLPLRSWPRVFQAVYGYVLFSSL